MNRFTPYAPALPRKDPEGPRTGPPEGSANGGEPVLGSFETLREVGSPPGGQTDTNGRLQRAPSRARRQPQLLVGEGLRALPFLSLSLSPSPSLSLSPSPSLSISINLS